MKKIIIIGGGIAGLATAYRIQRKISEGADLECILLEGSAVSYTHLRAHET